jgi:energy-converting hydrogenase Eha subunit A
MHKLVILIGACLFLFACAPAATPTPRPTLPATPTRVPPSPTAVSKSPSAPSAATATPASALSLQNIKKDRQADGSWLTSASVSAPEQLGVGQIEFAAPEKMLFTETRTIRLRLSPAQQLVALTPVPAPGKTPDIPGFVYRFSGNVQLYPIMFAELRALAFEIDQKGPVRRILEANKPVEWAWVIRPLVAGRHDLTLELSIPVIINGVTTEFSTKVLHNLTVSILVETSLPTPRPVTDRIGDSIIEHSGAIIAALIGILSTLLGALLAMRRARAKK